MKLGILGCGNMASAIVKGITGSGVISGSDILLYDISPRTCSQLAGSTGAAAMASAEELASASDIMLAAVKPNVIKDLLCDISDALKQKALISIAAGISSAQLKNYTGHECRILRVMPNTPALSGAGATALSLETDLNDAEKQFAVELFEAVGIVEWVPEKLINAICGVSGSGPAYAAMFIEAMADGGVRMGLPRKLAYEFAAQTVMGTAKLMLDTGKLPAEIKDMVSSPGGTTIEAVYALEKGGMRASVMEAVTVCTQKADNIGG